MMRLVRALVMLPFLLWMGACNIAVSDKPMFSDAQRSALKLMDGYWVIDEAECRFDETQAVDRWPECAEWAVLADNRIVRERNENLAAVAPDLLIADGVPLIIQLVEKASAQKAPLYHFAAFEPTKLHPDGRITAISLWVVQCGHEDTQIGSGKTTVRPYPGFNADCRPDSVASLRAAAAASRPATAQLGKMKWLRTEAP